MKIGIPVKCQNGHSATWIIEIDGLDVTEHGVDHRYSCSCPKGEIGEGFRESGKPFVIPEGLPISMPGFSVIVDRCIPEETIICGSKAFEYFRSAKANGGES